MGTALCAPRDKDIREEQSTGINLIIDTLMPLSQQLTMGALMVRHVQTATLKHPPRVKSGAKGGRTRKMRLSLLPL